jgi:cytochrome P450
MSLWDGLEITTRTDMIAFLLPKWIKNLPIKRFQESKAAYEQLMAFMRSQVAERKAEIVSRSSSIAEKRDDVFTLLVRANEDEHTKFQLDDQEVIGNVFVMLIAGHETTARAISATIAFLGLHDDIQEEVYEQIMSVVGPDRDPALDHYARLDKVLAVFYEALRMFPGGHLMIREAYKDTILQIPNPHGQEGITTVHIRKGMQVRTIHHLDVVTLTVTNETHTF